MKRHQSDTGVSFRHANVANSIDIPWQPTITNAETLIRSQLHTFTQDHESNAQIDLLVSANAFPAGI